MSRDVYLIADRYELREAIGDGGTSTVFRAFDRMLDCERAVKLLRVRAGRSKKRRLRFELEARAMARVRHPNVLPIYDVGSHEGAPYLVMAYARNGSVYDLQRKEGRLTVRDAVVLMLPVLAALEAAHQAGIVHRDIKPANILLDSDGTPWVADFGIARLVDTDNRYTRAGAALGTFSYMAPEQRLDAHQAGTRADVYAVAASLYELVTGESPMDLFAAAAGSPRWWSVPSPLREVLQNALRHDPRERFVSADAFRLALEDIVPHCSAERAVAVAVETEPEHTAPGIEDGPDPLLVRWYRQSLVSKAAELRSCLRRLPLGDEEAETDIRRIGHRLRGSGQSYGFAVITKAAKDVELAELDALANRAAELLSIITHIATTTSDPRPDRPTTEPITRSVDQSTPDGGRVLLVDDDDDIASVVRRSLEADGHMVARLADGDGVLAFVRRARPDIVLLDVELPGRSGFRVLQDLKSDEELRTIPVLMVTARNDDALVVRGLDLGAEDYVSKPFVPGVLRARVRRVLRRAAAPVVVQSA